LTLVQQDHLGVSCKYLCYYNKHSTDTLWVSLLVSLHLVFILCIEVLNVCISKFDDRNLIKESMYWEVRVNISNFCNNVLNEILEVNPVIILIILFCCWKILLLSTESPQNDTIFHNSMMISEINHFKSI
jgi:hypothetical protein